MIPIPELELLIPQEELTAIYNGRYEEIVQMLSDLGFLIISDKENHIVDNADLFEAIREFRDEAHQASLSDNCENCYLPESPKESPDELITPQELNLLQLLVSLDGDFKLANSFSFATPGILMRVFNYRLNLLGLYEGPILDYYTSSTDNGWNKLLRWLSPLGKNEILELTGELHQLISTITQTPQFKDSVLYFKYQPSNGISNHYEIKGENTNDFFTNQLKKSIDTSSANFKTFNKQIKAIEPDIEYLEMKCNSDENKFVIRLMQLHQWVSGYYLGTIDGEIGEITFNSFIELAKNEVESGNIDFRLPLLIAHIKDEYWVANSRYFFDNIKIEENDQTDIGWLFHEFSNEYEKTTPELRQVIDDNLKAAWKEINVDKNRDFKSVKFRFRRIYFGVKNMVKSFCRSIKRIFNGLLVNTKEFIANITNHIKNFAKLLFKEIREGIQLFSRGLAFLFINRTLKSDSYLSHFDFDSDSIHFSPDVVTEELARKHIIRIQNTVHALDFAMTLTGKLVRFILLTQGIGWHRILIEVGVIFKDMITNRQKLLNA